MGQAGRSDSSQPEEDDIQTETPLITDNNKQCGGICEKREHEGTGAFRTGVKNKMTMGEVDLLLPTPCTCWEQRPRAERVSASSPTPDWSPSEWMLQLVSDGGGEGDRIERA